jgi:hypothetical protein
LKSVASNPEGVVRATNIDSAIRKWQFEQADTLGLKNLDKINNETRLSKNLLDAIGKEYSGAAGNNAVTLTDYIMLAGGDPTAIAGFLVKKTLSSKGVQAKIAEMLNKGNPVMGEVGAEMGPSKVPRLEAPKPGTPNYPQNFVPPKLPTRSLPDEAMTAKPQSPQSQGIESKTYNQNSQINKSTNPTTNKVSNRTIPESIPQKKGIFQRAVDKFKNTPGKQGGYVRMPSGKIIKAIDEPTKAEIYKTIKYLNEGEVVTANERVLNNLMNKYEISYELSVAQIKQKLSNLLEKTKTR